MGLLLLLLSICLVIAVSIRIVVAIVDWKSDPKGSAVLLGLNVFCIICATCAVIKYIPVFHL